jgi:IS30 family transposase
MQYNHLTIEEREIIQRMLWQKISLREIAQAIKRNVSTVSREIKKNNPKQHKIYTPRLAQERALTKRKHRGRTKRLKNEAVRQYVTAKLKLGWSPEQISATAFKAVGTSISYEAIYQYVYAQIYRSGHGHVKPDCEDLRPYLARHRKRRAAQGMRQAYRVDKGPLPSIETRPPVVEARQEIGHWEDDCVVSRANTERLKTLNERQSGIIFIEKIRDGTILETNLAVQKRLITLPAKLRKTLTRDRGSENMGYQELEKLLGLDCYFAHSYCSWERGSNENGNGLIRRFLPKKTDFKTVSDEQIRTIEHLLNSRPRKRLGWKTPYEVFYELTGVALEG